MKNLVAAKILGTDVRLALGDPTNCVELFTRSRHDFGVRATRDQRFSRVKYFRAHVYSVVHD